LKPQQIVSEIIHHKFRPQQLSDYAILYRGNHQSRLFERGLRETTSYFISGSTSFFAYSEIKDILGYLRLFVNQDDDAAFLRVIKHPKREIGPTTLEKLGDYPMSGISAVAASARVWLEPETIRKSMQRLGKFRDWFIDTADRIERGDTFAVIEQFIDQIGYEQWLRKTAKPRNLTKSRRLGVMFTDNRFSLLSSWWFVAGLPHFVLFSPRQLQS